MSIRADLVARADRLAARWPSLQPSERRIILAALVDRIDLLSEMLEIRIRPGRLPAILSDEEERQDWKDCEENGAPVITLAVPARLRRTGAGIRLVIDGARAERKPDHSLHRVLAQAYHYNALVMRGGGKTMAELAAEAGVGGSYFTRILRLGFLAPDIVHAILHDRHPIELSAKRLVNESRIPIAWDHQRAQIGF